MILPKYSFGFGDRFGQQGKAQLRTLIEAQSQGIDIAPVWNKSHREHCIVGTSPDSVRVEADGATQAVKWNGPYFVDADHISLGNIDLFLESSDFFTIDVADFIDGVASADAIADFVAGNRRYVGSLSIPGIAETLEISEAYLEGIARKYLCAIGEAGKLYRYIAKAKGADNFVTEVSMDETDLPQTPVDMLFILAALAQEKVPLQTIAPKFSGRFNKGVEYVGDIAQFTLEFENHLSVIAYAIKEFGLPENLKLSVHSGSDKFSLYGPMREALQKHDAGVHIKTAGTTWLEELIGLACAGGEGLAIAKEVYLSALGRLDELIGPYASVIDIDQTRLPSADEVAAWRSEDFAAALRHDATCPQYNVDLRQLLHVAFKVAAEMGDRYTDALSKFEDTVAQNVGQNLLERHVRPLFLSEDRSVPEARDGLVEQNVEA